MIEIQKKLFLPDVAPFQLLQAEKEKYLCNYLGELMTHHRQACQGYDALVGSWQANLESDYSDLAAYPYVPVSIFKEFELVSSDQDLVVIESSATTSNNASKIFVNKESRKRQALSANTILQDYVGSKRRPYIVFDLESTVRGAKSFSARGAAIMALAHLAKKFYFVMKEQDGQLVVDHDALNAALQDIDGEPFVAYGFTYLLYQAHEDISDLQAHPESCLLHSGGWKKLVDLAVDKTTFNKHVAQSWGLEPERVIDFYGTVEQVGMAYPDCSAGLKHAPYWADVIVRRTDTLEPAEIGEPGLIQLVSCLPLSAPNHSVLTEDLGVIHTVDDCACGRKGKAFEFLGRAPKSEVRGCSDVVRR